MIRIPKTIYDRMLAQAKSEAPNECCGLLGGLKNTVDRIFPMTNIHHSPTLYMIDPKEQFAVFKALRNDGVDLLAIYHSHPQTAAYPSSTDVRMAYYPEAVYIIISLEHPDRPAVKAYRIMDRVITGEDIEIVET